MTDNENQFSEGPALNRSQVKRDYYNKNFSNPYFEKNKKGPSRFNTVFYLRVLFFCFATYLIVYSDLFKITKVTISGNEMIPQQAISDIISKNAHGYKYFILPRRNQFFFSKKQALNDLNTSFKLEKATIRRGWKSLSVTIQEKVSYSIIYNVKNQTFYFMDSNGFITQELNREGAIGYMGFKKFPVLNVNVDTIATSTQLTNQKTAQYILDLDKYLKTQPLNVGGYEQRGTDEITLVTKEGWRAYFDVNADIQSSVENLFLVKNKIGTKKFEYIDLRFGSKVFYK